MKTIGKKKKSRIVELILIMAAFGIASIANALSRTTVQAEVAASIADAKRLNMAVVREYELP